MGTSHSSTSSLDITISHIAAFSVIIFSATLLVPPHLQQQSIAQEQQQPPYNRTAFDTENSIENLSFGFDDVPGLSHYKTVVNGIEIHYVIAGEGKGNDYPIVLLHGWPQTWYEWRHIIPELVANNYTIIAPDLRGLGNSEKPQTGYDKKTIAEDIYQLVNKLGYDKIYLVGHDWGGVVAYSYTAEHPEDVIKMIILDIFLPGFGLEEAGNFSPNGIWHLSFHAVRDLPERLIEGKEEVYLNWFYDWTYNQSALTAEAREEYIKQYSKPGALRAGFEYYRAVFEDAEQNKEYAQQKLDIPILTIGGEAGIGNNTAISFQKVANNVTGITLPNTGHFIPEERPNFLIEQILDFFK